MNFELTYRLVSLTHAKLNQIKFFAGLKLTKPKSIHVQNCLRFPLVDISLCFCLRDITSGDIWMVFLMIVHKTSLN